MSYCRWSSDDFGSDVYVYAHVDGGYRIEVASNHIVWKKPLPAPVDIIQDSEKWIERSFQISALLRDPSSHSREPLPEPSRGRSQHYDTPSECAQALIDLKDEGFSVPQGAIDALLVEANETSTEGEV